MKRELLYTILLTDDGMKVESVLKSRLSLSSKAIRRAKFLDDGIMLDGKRVFTTHIVSAGQTLSFNLENADDKSENIVPVKGDIDIVYEDDDLLVINKGRNMPVHPSLGHFDDTLANRLAYYYAQKGENFVFRAVNRLDGNTSGLMIVAKTSHTHKVLGEQLHSNSFERTYEAVVCSAPDPLEGVIDAPIRRKDEHELLRIVAPDGQRAVTHYKTIETNGNYSLVRLVLETGRTHQIRVHMAHIGCPVAGDFLYGREDTDLIKGHALHSKTLRFVHPVSKKEMYFEAPLPKDMADILQQNGMIIKNKDINLT